MAFWNVRAAGEAERTTLATESTERRYSTGRGYCVEAPNEPEARRIARNYVYQVRGHDMPADRRVALRERQRVPVLSYGLARGMVAAVIVITLAGPATAAPPRDAGNVNPATAPAAWHNQGSHGNSSHGGDNSGGWSHGSGDSHGRQRN
jgi:hypothetical protein